MRALVHRLNYLLIRVVTLFFERLPLSWAAAIGRWTGSLIYRLDRRHRKITLMNLQRALGRHYTETELRGIALRSYRHVGCSVAEFMKLGALSAEEVGRWVTIEGLEHFEAARALGKGVLFLTAHFGNWELMSVAVSFKGYRVYGVARPLDNPYLDHLIRKRREMGGNRVVSKFGASQEAAQVLKSGEAIGFLLDQNVSGRGGVFVPFFDQPASTSKGLALIALRTGAPVIPSFIVREGDRHRVIMGKAVEMVRSDDLHADIIENTARFTGIIESYVRRYPDQWLWMHRRWKTQPAEKNV